MRFRFVSRLFILLAVSLFAIHDLTLHTVSAQVPQAPNGDFVIYGVPPVGDGLQPSWKNGSLFNGVNTWNLVDTEQVYEGQHALSWTASAPFERGWLTAPQPVDVSKYSFLNFYARAKQQGQRYEVGFVDAQGNMIGNWQLIDTGGGPIQPDRWQAYSFPMTSFGLPAATVGGIGFRDANGAPSPKVFFDNIHLSQNKAQPAVNKPGTGQTISGGPSNPELSGIALAKQKPPAPYYPQISPWVFIIPGLIIFLAIFFE